MSEPRQVNNLRGMTFGRLTVVAFAGISKSKNALWLCACECGGLSKPTSSNLKTGGSTSCGCGFTEMLLARLTTHGMTKTRPYKIWQNMRNRCANPEDEYFKDYGGRGIRVCERWLDSFENFWADMQEGYQPRLTLNRVENGGDYCKGNCAWATWKEQARNTRHNRVIDTPQGKMLLVEASERSGLSISCLKGRLDSGWPTARIFDAKLPVGHYAPWRKR